MTLAELYEHEIKRRSVEERLRIAHWILHDVTREDAVRKPEPARPRRSLLELEVPTYSPEACPLCADGSTPEKPGSRASR